MQCSAKRHGPPNRFTHTRRPLRAGCYEARQPSALRRGEQAAVVADITCRDTAPHCRARTRRPVPVYGKNCLPSKQRGLWMRLRTASPPTKPFSTITACGPRGTAGPQAACRNVDNTKSSQQARALLIAQLQGQLITTAPDILFPWSTPKRVD